MTRFSSAVSSGGHFSLPDGFHRPERKYKFDALPGWGTRPGKNTKKRKIKS